MCVCVCVHVHLPFPSRYVYRVLFSTPVRISQDTGCLATLFKSGGKVEFFKPFP